MQLFTDLIQGLPGSGQLCAGVLNPGVIDVIGQPLSGFSAEFLCEVIFCISYSSGQIGQMKLFQQVTLYIGTALLNRP